MSARCSAWSSPRRRSVVQGGGPQSAVAGAVQPLEHRLDLLGGGEPRLAAVDRRDADTARRVRVDLAELAGAAVHRAQRSDGGRDRRRGETVRGQAVDEPLQRRKRELAQTLVAELVEDVQPQHLFVSPDRGGLVRIAHRVRTIPARAAASHSSAVSASVGPRSALSVPPRTAAYASCRERRAAEIVENVL
jgi:hypothetical protein